MVLDRLAELPLIFDDAWKTVGKEAEAIALAFPGDNIEQCGSHYANQSFNTGLNVLEQRELVADAFDRLIDTAASKGVPVKVMAVGGNHGENRGGKKRPAFAKAFTVTDYSDNDDIAIFHSLRAGLRQVR